jgi:hypothetical protein
MCWRAERCQQLVEQRHGRVRVDGRAGAQRVLPTSLERGLQLVAHPLRGVGVQAAHAGYLVPEALLGEDLRYAVLSHPGLVAVSESVRS